MRRGDRAGDCAGGLRGVGRSGRAVHQQPHARPRGTLKVSITTPNSSAAPRARSQPPRSLLATLCLEHAYTPTCVAPAGTVGEEFPAHPGTAEVRCSTSRRMSFIGSYERTSGPTSKLLTGGGELVNHSSELAFHGSGPAIAPCLRLRVTLTIVTSTPAARMNEPIVEIRL